MFPVLSFVVSVFWAQYCLSCSKMKMKGAFLEYILLPNRSSSVSSVISVSTEFAQISWNEPHGTTRGNSWYFLMTSGHPQMFKQMTAWWLRWFGYWAWIWSKTEIALYTWVEPFKPFKRIFIPEGREAVSIQSIQERLEDRKLIAIWRLFFCLA